jgi:hypothetical protein
MFDSEEDSLEELFDPETEILIQGFYDNRCAFCLDKLIEEGSRCTGILDPSEKGAPQVCIEQSL